MTRTIAGHIVEVSTQFIKNVARFSGKNLTYFYVQRMIALNRYAPIKQALLRAMDYEIDQTTLNVELCIAQLEMAKQQLNNLQNCKQTIERQ
jgi:hypothetical protein